MDVYARGAAARGCDVFLSLHSNACDTESVDYPVVYRAYDNLNDADTLARALALSIGQLMRTRQQGRTATRRNNTGGEYYGVLRGARAAGVPVYLLVEHSFHTNTAAAKWLSVDENLNRLAEAEADLLAGYFNVQTVPEIRTSIMGTAQATAQQMALFCRSRNPAPQITGCSLEALAQMYLIEGATEGVRGDVAFAQSLHETGFFRFGGIVQPGQNNFAGIGALNGNTAGQAATFPNTLTGVRAQIQHLKAYASTEPLKNPCVDPRFGLVTRGSAPYVEWLGAADNPSGAGWAYPGKGYGASVLTLLSQLIAQTVPQPKPPQSPAIPDWQRSGLQTLTEAGVINSPDYWEARFLQNVTVGELFGILGNLFTEVPG